MVSRVGIRYAFEHGAACRGAGLEFGGQHCAYDPFQSGGGHAGRLHPYCQGQGNEGVGVIVHHALKNAMLPVLTMMALQVSSMLSGAVLTESVFGIPGIGRLAVNAIENRDMPLLQGTVIFTTILVIAGNLIADLLYSVLDPRIREGA